VWLSILNQYRETAVNGNGCLTLFKEDVGF
jgi:hypothetical protein